MDKPTETEESRQCGRPAALSRSAVLDAALALLDDEGIDAVTIRRLAGALGVSPMTLYRHVADKDELLLALIDQLAARLRYPDRPDDSGEAILVMWVTLYDGLAAHTWLPEVLARRRLMAASVLDVIEEIHANLVTLGLSPDQAVVAYRVMWHFTLGTLLVRAGETSGAISVQAQLRSTPDPERHPTLAAAADHWRAGHGRDTYLADLTVLLKGLLNPR